MSAFDYDIMLIEEKELFRCLFVLTGWTVSPFDSNVVVLPLDRGEYVL